MAVREHFQASLTLASATGNTHVATVAGYLDAERARGLSSGVARVAKTREAKRVLAERLSIPPEDAFDILRGSARSTQTKLHDLSREVVLSPGTPPSVADEIARRRRLGG